MCCPCRCHINLAIHGRWESAVGSDIVHVPKVDMCRLDQEGTAPVVLGRHKVQFAPARAVFRILTAGRGYKAYLQSRALCWEQLKHST